VLAEIPHVRKDLGYPNMQTPYSQFVATQALLNVLYGRYEVVPDEIRNFVLGYWGRPPGPVDAEVLDRAGQGKQPITERPGEVVPPGLPRAREEMGASVSDEDLLLNILYMPRVLDELRAAGPLDLQHPLAFSPVVDIVRQAAAGGSVRSLSLAQAG
jgi:oxaloacetate decarboxylase (Na+ extruding) subunit alpha